MILTPNFFLPFRTTTQAPQNVNLTQSIRHWVDARIADKDPSTTRSMFSSGTTRDPNFWAADADLTCVGIGSDPKGALISPRHFLTANHYFPSTGQTQTFVKRDGTAVDRTVTAYQNGGDDTYIGILDSDVPADITPATVLPSNALAKFQGGIVGLPVLTTNAALHGGVAEIQTTNPFSAGNNMFLKRPSGTRDSFSFTLIAGDSGHPALLIINGKSVLLMSFHFGGFGGGPFTTSYLAGINAAMHTLSVGAGADTDYQLTQTDLSKFRTF